MLIATKIDTDLTQVGADTRRLAGDSRRGIGLAADGRFAGAIHPGFLHRYRLAGITQPVAVIEGNGGDHGHIGLHHIGGIEPTTQADFQQQHVRCGAAEEPQTGQGRKLEEGERYLAARRFHFGKGGAVIAICQLLTVDPHPLGKAQQMGRGVDANLVAGGHQNAGRHGAAGALAVGTRHREHLERQSGEPHATCNRADPLQPHVDRDRMDLLQIRKPVDKRPALGLMHV